MKAFIRLFLSACLFLTVPSGMLCVQKVSPCVGGWANAVRASLCKQLLKRVLKTSITAHPFSSSVALMSDSSTSVPPLEGLRHVWFDGFAVSVGLPLSLRVSLQLITSVSAFHPSLL